MVFHCFSFFLLVPSLEKVFPVAARHPLVAVCLKDASYIEHNKGILLDKNIALSITQASHPGLGAWT